MKTVAKPPRIGKISRQEARRYVDGLIDRTIHLRQLSKREAFALMEQLRIAYCVTNFGSGDDDHYPILGFCQADVLKSIMNMVERDWGVQPSTHASLEQWWSERNP
jgi:hypothetical protein